MGHVLTHCISYDGDDDLVASAFGKDNSTLLAQIYHGALKAPNRPNQTRQSDGFDNSAKAITQSFWLNLFTMVLQFVAFSVLMRSSVLAKVLARRYEGERPSPWGWALEAWRRTQHKHHRSKRRRKLYLALGNLDGAVMVRFCVLGFKFSAAGTLFCFFLVPWYVWWGDDWDASVTSFDMYNLANLKNAGRAGFWPVLVAAYLLIALFTHFALEEWRTFVDMRKAHFARRAGVLALQGEEAPDFSAAQAVRSVLVEYVPKYARGMDGVEVADHFERLFQDHKGVEDRVHSCVVQAETGWLYKSPEALLASAGRMALMGLRDAQPDVHRRYRSRSMEETRDPSTDDSDDGLDLADQARGVFTSIWRRGREVSRLLMSVLIGSLEAGNENSGSSTAFITFYSLADRVLAERMFLDSTPFRWWARAAPEASDMIWPNAAVPRVKVQSNGFVLSALTLVMLLGWSFPVALLQTWASALVPWLFKDLKEWGVLGQQIFSFLIGQLPLLALMGLQYLLPAIFEFSARNVERIKINSDIQRRVLELFFRFQLATLYVTVFSSSLLQNFCQILNRPSNVFSVIQTRVPAVATYFISYVMTRAGLSTPLLLLFPVLFAGQKDENDEPASYPPNYAMEATNLGMVLVLGMTYSVVAPLIMPACMVFFFLASLVYRWLFLFTYTPDFNCDGGIWYELFNGSMVGLLLGTLSMAAAAGAYCGFGSAEFLAALTLVFLVIAIHRHIHVHYSRPSQFISLADARAIDRVCAGNIDEWLRGDYYLDPVIKGQPEESAAMASNHAAAMNPLGCCRKPPIHADTSGSEDSDDMEDSKSSSHASEALLK